MELPLDGAECSTSYETLAQTELPYPVGKFPSVRCEAVWIGVWGTKSVGRKGVWGSDGLRAAVMPTTHTGAY